MSGETAFVVGAVVIAVILFAVLFERIVKNL
jgi:hypothetical protein